MFLHKYPSNVSSFTDSWRTLTRLKRQRIFVGDLHFFSNHGHNLLFVFQRPTDGRMHLLYKPNLKVNFIYIFLNKFFLMHNLISFMYIFSGFGIF